jgi:hypothetical protein
MSGGFGSMRFGAGFAYLQQKAKEAVNTVNTKVDEAAAANAAAKSAAAVSSSATTTTTTAATTTAETPPKPAPSSSIANAMRDELVDVLQKMKKKARP